MSTEPVARNLSDLTQEVSAIREFASQQQDHVRRLQDGYDWNIIKRFCLRVIRCIDNLDDRINKLTEEEIEFQGLEDVRDELVFALESSGVEQFEPELGSDYKGQEKYLEAVKERSETEDADLSGKIAEVVRFGYKYVISDDEVRFVRSAQVKLYV
jgi:molecular chaperone GrpE (heat shock protein)